MQMNDSQKVPASIDKVWAGLNDPAILKQCIPGCQNLEMSSPTDMTATVVIKVGPVKATFSGKVTLSDLDPPNGYRISGEGSGGVAGFAKGGASVTLTPDGLGATNLHYKVDAQIGGKLAQLGGRLIDATAKKLAGEFFNNFGATFAPAAPAEAAPEKTGWFKKVFSSGAAALVLMGGLLLPECCLNGSHMHLDTQTSFPICRALTHQG